MQLLPTPPTDNVYKFIAIVGVWMFVGLTLFITWFTFWCYQSEIEQKHVNDYYFSMRKINSIEQRLESIKTGRIDENKLSWVPKELSTAEELKFLGIALNNHNNTVKKYKSDAEKEHNNFVDYIGFDTAKILFYIYYACTFFCFIFGFYMWIKKIEVPLQKNIELDIKIKELTIKKMKGELQAQPEEVRSWQLQSGGPESI